MVIAKGVSLGPYEIIAHLGSGGMGEVWRARDRRIGRDVAIKVLPEAFAPGDERVLRFEQEARAAGALNHPGLVTIFDVGSVHGAPYIVMELLEGETLRDALGDMKPVALPLRKAIHYASQVAFALGVAHEKGIIHRDLKPENLFVTSDRRVKILDFGLAKLAHDTTDADGRRKTSKHLTSAGIVVGTPLYMSPEQVRAAPIDHRTDIFSLGSVLYEMITGRTVFERFTAVETMHAVLTDEPPPIESPEISPALEATIRHCLEKDPRERFQSARDLAFHLQSLPEMQRVTASSHRALPRQRPRWYRAAVIGLPVVLALAAGGFVLRGLRPDSSLAVTPTYKQLTSADGLEIFPTLAPDGKSFAYVSSQSGNRDIYVQRVDGRAAINITADWQDDDSEPAFSPDGSQIAFRSEREGGGIFVMSVTGESPRRLTNFGHNPAWSPDATRLAVGTDGIELLPHNRARMSELWIVDVRNGTSRPLAQPHKGGPDFGSDSDAVQPSWSPHGNRIAFGGQSAPNMQRDIWTIDPNAPEPKKTVVRVTESALNWNPVWSPDGKYLYYGSDRNRTLNLWRVPMNEETGRPTGMPELVALPASVAGHFTFAKSGELAYVAVANSYRLMAVPFDANTAVLGPPRQLLAGSQEIYTFAPSPDGKVIAYTTGGWTQEDVFIADADGTHVRQLTNDDAKDRSVEWSPDGKALYYYSNRGEDGYRIWSIRADGSGLTRVTDDADLKRIGARQLYWPVPSPDGRTLIVRTDREVSALVHLDRPAGRQLEPIPVFLVTPKWSPDGKFIAGRDQIVRPNDLRGRILRYSLSTRSAEPLSENGSSPHWTPDGRKIVYFERQNIRILDLETGAATAVPFQSIAGVPVDVTAISTRLSRDATTVYVSQTIRQGDIWIVRNTGLPAFQR